MKKQNFNFCSIFFVAIGFALLFGFSACAEKKMQQNAKSSIIDDTDALGLDVLAKIIQDHYSEDSSSDIFVSVVPTSGLNRFEARIVEQYDNSTKFFVINAPIIIDDAVINYYIPLYESEPVQYEVFLDNNAKFARLSYRSALTLTKGEIASLIEKHSKEDDHNFDFYKDYYVEEVKLTNKTNFGYEGSLLVFAKDQKGGGGKQEDVHIFMDDDSIGYQYKGLDGSVQYESAGAYFIQTYISENVPIKEESASNSIRQVTSLTIEEIQDLLASYINDAGRMKLKRLDEDSSGIHYGGRIIITKKGSMSTYASDIAVVVSKTSNSISYTIGEDVDNWWESNGGSINSFYIQNHFSER
jgi:hypothetical protein